MTSGMAFRHRASLRRARLKPELIVATANSSPLVETWNRLGGMFTKLGRVAGIDPATSLAVWMVECGGLAFTHGKPVLRFEAHVFFDRWGKANEVLFDNHFQFGGRNGIEGARWQQHKFRHSANDVWQRSHGDQHIEYRVFALAEKLAGREVACLSASFGGPQIMGFNHSMIGYNTASDLAVAFACSERWQVCGFFDFCAAKEIVEALKALDWLSFAKTYNGPGNAKAYAAKIAEAHGVAKRLIETAS